MSDDREALDAYSRTIVAVAETVLPSVASLEVRTARGRAGAGSASIITRDGYLLTSAHVVAGATTAEATFTDGTTIDRRRRRPGHPVGPGGPPGTW